MLEPLLQAIFWYCILAWIVAIALLKIPGDCGIPFVTELRNGPLHRRLLFWGSALLLAPLLLPVTFYRCTQLLIHNARELRMLRRTHRELVLRQLHSANLPASAEQFFDEQTPELAALGFVECGNYLLKDEPLAIYARVWQSADGVTLAVLEEIDQSHSCTFITLFADGRLLETGASEPSPIFEKFLLRSRMFVQGLADATLAELLAKHLAETAQLAASYETQALAFAPEQSGEILHYENRLASDEFYEIGERDEYPPEPILPSGTPCTVAALAV